MQRILQNMSNQVHTVHKIVQELCSRDERFMFLKSALEEFIDASKINTRLKAFSVELDPVLTTQPSHCWSWIDLERAMRVLCKQEEVTPRPVDPIDRMEEAQFLDEIILSVIYELLHVFDIDIRQPPANKRTSFLDPSISWPLQSLYEQSKSLKPKPTRAMELRKKDEIPVAVYQYRGELDSAAGQVRVLEILPGVRDDPIQCRLIVCDLYKEGIAEALSYVWGADTSQEAIHVDQEAFLIRKNLTRILQHLRRADVVRTIWVDAICINQSDRKEKTQQVRLMRDIYSKATSTIIWLGDFDVESTRSKQRCMADSVDNDEFYTPLPKRFGGTTMNEYDLCAILDAYQKCVINKQWDKEYFSLHMMLCRCVDHIILHEWWERIWTLQEAFLPEKGPIIFFQGQSFSFNDLQAAIKLIFEDKSSQDFHDAQAHFKSSIAGSEMDKLFCKFVGARRALDHPLSLLFHLRPGLDMDRSPLLRYLPSLLASTDTYRASNPSDKIFALESLLPRCLGLLINVDYDESREAVFQRITARCYNQSGLHLVRHYKFLFESPLLPGETLTGPSWVLDFTYSDASRHDSKSAKAVKDQVTLDGFLYENTIYDPRIDKNHYLCFATPRTLFCSGRCIDQVYLTISIPSLSNHEHWATYLRSLRILISTRRSILISKFGDHPEHPFRNGIPISFMCLLKDDESRVPQEAGENFAAFVESRLQEHAGKTCFVTSNGIIGIATAAVKRGDVLAWVYVAPVYLMLREVIEEGESKSTTQQHKIVARAAIAADMDNTKALIDSAPEKSFQIV
ncbi:heterokaryon incompatibility protein-domain-containing protein [Xylaria sp. FL1777]|nr:heterokaryon incompatibility protein-domain-containing protein [Xylaria sp. FL1777]